MKVYIDVTNLMEVNFLTGIQRVVREVVVRLLKYDGFQLVLLKYNPTECCFEILNNTSFFQYFKEGFGQKSDLKTGKRLSVDTMETGMIFLDIDSVWNSPYKRSVLLPQLKGRGIKIVTYIYDIIPITYPQFFHTNTLYYFMDYFGANLQYSDAFIVSTQSVLDGICQISERMGLKRIPGFVSWLGSDFHIKQEEDTIRHDAEEFIQKKQKYVLIVGTVEPRKNHKIVLDAFDKELFDKDICLVIVGKIGWNVEDLEKRIRSHPQIGRKLYFFEGLNDASVNLLYKNALFVAFPTYDEGFGLPMIEAFQRGVPVIASDCPVLREVGGERAVYFKTESADSFLKVLNRYLDDLSQYEALKEKVRTFVPFTWDQATKRIADVLKKFQEVSVPAKSDVEQMVILSARCSDICRTLPFVEHFMPFIKRLVLCCPDAMKDEFERDYSGRLQVSVITDSMLLEEKELPHDHQMRNFYLRSLAMRREELDPVFIMSDDDYRPLEEIDKTVFVEEGRYQAYYCHSLKTWKGTAGNETSYNLGMFKTLEFLEEHQYPVLQYSSHMPQIIDKEKYLEFLDTHKDVELTGIDEWSSYFNWLSYVYPEMVRIRPYVTMCWPGSPTDWKQDVIPEMYLFENFYEELYEETGIFKGFSRDYYEGIERENETKRRFFEKRQNQFIRYEKLFELYKNTYRNQYRELPSFVILANEKIEFHFPHYIVLPMNGFVRLPVTIWSEDEEEVQLQISYSLEQRGEVQFSLGKDIFVVVRGVKEIEIPMFSAPKGSGKMWLSITVVYKGKEYCKGMQAEILDAADFLKE